ncbi:hypothetical protein [Halomicronema hongdechloris]|uniref:hypothetical protein n=1 Tax=Halomicronema hongdechloris TaxID=1209493 RepID=UPI001CEDCCA0|nr:hypothetical protein [Halomicronema hongdechloris]
MAEPDFPTQPESSAADAVGDQAQVSPPQQRAGITALAYGLWVLIARLLLLGVGISAAWLLGGWWSPRSTRPGPQNRPCRKSPYGRGIALYGGCGSCPNGGKGI